MHPKSKEASISMRLDHIANMDGFDAARRLVSQRRLGVSQKEADAWLRKELFKRNWWKVTVGAASVVGAIATVAALFNWV